MNIRSVMMLLVCCAVPGKHLLGAEKDKQPGDLIQLARVMPRLFPLTLQPTRIDSDRYMHDSYHEARQRMPDFTFYAEDESFKVTDLKAQKEKSYNIGKKIAHVFASRDGRNVCVNTQHHFRFLEETLNTLEQKLEAAQGTLYVFNFAQQKVTHGLKSGHGILPTRENECNRAATRFLVGRLLGDDLYVATSAGVLHTIAAAAHEIFYTREFNHDDSKILVAANTKETGTVRIINADSGKDELSIQHDNPVDKVSETASFFVTRTKNGIIHIFDKQGAALCQLPVSGSTFFKFDNIDGAFGRNPTSCTMSTRCLVYHNLSADGKTVLTREFYAGKGTDDSQELHFAGDLSFLFNALTPAQQDFLAHTKIVHENNGYASLDMVAENCQKPKEEIQATLNTLNPALKAALIANYFHRKRVCAIM